MAIRGTVTNTGGSKPWTARYADGEFIGIFLSLRDAQVPIELSANARLKWTLETSEGYSGLESYRGEDV